MNVQVPKKLVNRAHRRTHRRGGAAIEFALILPVLLIAMLGIFDLSSFLRDRQNVVFAAWDVAIFAARGGEEATDAVLLAYARDSAAQRGENPEDVSLTVVRGEDAGEEIATVTLSVPVRALVGTLPLPTTHSVSFTVTVLEG